MNDHTQLGSKEEGTHRAKKSIDLQTSDHVVVENHGNQWLHQAQIIDTDMDEGLQVGNHVINDNHGKYWPNINVILINYPGLCFI